jgi:hypothetical protein
MFSARDSNAYSPNLLTGSPLTAGNKKGDYENGCTWFAVCDRRGCGGSLDSYQRTGKDAGSEREHSGTAFDTGGVLSRGIPAFDRRVTAVRCAGGRVSSEFADSFPSGAEVSDLRDDLSVAFGAVPEIREQRRRAGHGAGAPGPLITVWSS